MITVALETAEGRRRRALLDAKLNDWAIQTERLRALAGARCPTVGIGKC